VDVVVKAAAGVTKPAIQIACRLLGVVVSKIEKLGARHGKPASADVLMPK
jgi:hypothetical protein